MVIIQEFVIEMLCGMNELDRRILSLLKHWSTVFSWPDGATGGALHQRRRDQGSNPLSGLSRCCLGSDKSVR